MVSGLLGLALAASLTGTALAAEPKTAKTTEETSKTAAAETAKPAGQFSRWFPEMGVNPEAPKASEAVLAQMGTAIRQTKTVGGETLTLNGAVWDGGLVQLSLTAKSPSLPEVVDNYTWLNSDGCTARMPEEQWKAYVENKVERETAGEKLSKEERDQRLQSLMERAQMQLDPNLSVVSREGDTVQLAATMILDDYVEMPELTLRIENVEITGQAMEQPGTRSGEYVLKGPFEFTFTLDNMLPSMNYQGDVKMTFDKIPVRITAVSVSPKQITVGYTLDTNDPAVERKLSAYVKGIWTKDGKYVDCAGSFGIRGMLFSGDGGPITGDWDRSFPYPIDPAAVTAVDISGTRVELSRLYSAAE